MQVDHRLSAAGLVKTIDILRNDPRQDAGTLERSQRVMCRIRKCPSDSRPAKRRSAPVSSPFCGLVNEFIVLDGVAAEPVAMMIAVGRYAGRATDAGTRQRDPGCAL